MISLFGDARRLLKFEAVATDNAVFRLHYKVTVGMLIFASILLGAKQFFGEPIHCRVKEYSLPSKRVRQHILSVCNSLNTLIRRR